jgi:hypothetical protein
VVRAKTVKLFGGFAPAARQAKNPMIYDKIFPKGGKEICLIRSMLI